MTILTKNLKINLIFYIKMDIFKPLILAYLNEVSETNPN